MKCTSFIHRTRHKVDCSTNISIKLYLFTCLFVHTGVNRVTVLHLPKFDLFNNSVRFAFFLIEREETLSRHMKQKRPTSPADWCYFQSEDREQGANMAPRQRVCHCVANARLISRFMSLKEEKDRPLSPAGLFPANRGHSLFSKSHRHMMGWGRIIMTRG